MSIVPIRFHIRPITRLDTRQLVEVERDAFPTLWPPTNFGRELNNKLALYLAAPAAEDVAGFPGVEDDADAPTGLMERLGQALTRLFPGLAGGEDGEYLLGYLGLWQVVDDAHVVSVGVRTPFRRHGIGEALLVRAIEVAIDWRSRYVTLEVRVSNKPAITLYEKYGFRKAGVRKRYYLDNNEDAYIMTTDSILEPEYQQAFARLRSLHQQRMSPYLQPPTPIDLPAQ